MTNDVLLRLPEDKQETADEYRKKMQKKQDNGGLTLIIERKDEVIGFLSFPDLLISVCIILVRLVLVY